MPHYYFHLRTAAGVEVTDEEGDELPDTMAAEEHAIASVKQLVRGSPLDWRQASFEIHDDRNDHVLTVWFAEAAVRPLRSEHVFPPDDQHA